MRDRLNRYWRIVGTGFSFTVFGVFGLVLGVVVFPLLSLIVWDRHRRHRVARAVIQFVFRVFVDMMRGLGLFQYELIGFERLKRGGLLIMANHPSLIDTCFLMAFVSNSTCIVNARLFRNPFTFGPVSAAGYIPSDLGTDMIDRCVTELNGGANLIVFPEGTRTPIDGEIRFRRGAANVAVRGRRDVTPVVIRCTPRMLAKGVTWYRVPASASSYTLHVGDDLSVGEFLDGSTEQAAAARRLTAHLERFFTAQSLPHAFS